MGQMTTQIKLRYILIDISRSLLILTAIAMAISDSVTVSMGEETSGNLSLMFLVRLEPSSTESAGKSMYPGRMMMSLGGKRVRIRIHDHPHTHSEEP